MQPNWKTFRQDWFNPLVKIIFLRLDKAAKLKKIWMIHIFFKPRYYKKNSRPKISTTWLIIPTSQSEPSSKSIRNWQIFKIMRDGLLKKNWYGLHFSVNKALKKIRALWRQCFFSYGDCKSPDFKNNNKIKMKTYFRKNSSYLKKAFVASNFNEMCRLCLSEVDFLLVPIFQDRHIPYQELIQYSVDVSVCNLILIIIVS